MRPTLATPPAFAAAIPTINNHKNNDHPSFHYNQSMKMMHPPHRSSMYMYSEKPSKPLVHSSSQHLNLMSAAAHHHHHHHHSTVTEDARRQQHTVNYPYNVQAKAMNRIKTRGGIAKFRKSHRTLPSPCSSPLASSPASSSSLTPTTSTLTSRPTVLPEPVTKRRKTGPMGVPPPILTYLAPPPHHHPHFTPNQPSHQPPPKQTLFTPESLISTIHLPSLPVLIATYIHRIWHSTSSSPTPPPSFLSFTHKTLSLSSLPTSTILYALRLIHRLTIAHPTLTGAPGSECRLLVCALLTAMKCTCDHTYTNKTWERVCGIPGDEINVMEREFLGKLEWRVFVGSDEFWEFVGELEEFMESLPTPSPAQLNATSGTTSRPPSSNLMMMIPSPPISPLHHLPHSARLLSYPSYPYVSYYPSHHNHHTHQVYHRNIVV